MSTVINAFDNFYGSLDSSQKQKLIEHIINEHIKLALEGYDSGALVVLEEGYNSGSTVRLSNKCSLCGK